MSLSVAAVRLWSTATWTNLVCYKGHNNPVWDVKFGSVRAPDTHDPIRTRLFWTRRHIIANACRGKICEYYETRCFLFHLRHRCSLIFYIFYVSVCLSVRSVSSVLICITEPVECLISWCSAIVAYHVSLFARPHGHYFASCGHDNTARLWSTDHYQPLRLFTGHLSDVDVSKSVFSQFSYWTCLIKSFMHDLDNRQKTNVCIFN